MQIGKIDGNHFLIKALTHAGNGCVLARAIRCGNQARESSGIFLENYIMAERKRVRRNTLERRCLGKAFKRLFVKSPKGVFKMLEKVKRV